MADEEASQSIELVLALDDVCLLTVFVKVKDSPMKRLFGQWQFRSNLAEPVDQDDSSLLISKIILFDQLDFQMIWLGFISRAFFRLFVIRLAPIKLTLRRTTEQKLWLQVSLFEGVGSFFRRLGFKLSLFLCWETQLFQAIGMNKVTSLVSLLQFLLPGSRFGILLVSDLRSK